MAMRDDRYTTDDPRSVVVNNGSSGAVAIVLLLALAFGAYLIFFARGAAVVTPTADRPVIERTTPAPTTVPTLLTTPVVPKN